MHKLVDLSNLPRNKSHVDWKKSIGKRVYFEYNDIKGELNIIDYLNSYLTIKYNDKITKIHTGNFKNAAIGVCLGLKNIDIEIGRRFGKLVVKEDLGVITVGNKRKHMYQCICDCKNEKAIYKVKLISGATKSCGCLQRAKRHINQENMVFFGNKVIRRIHDTEKDKPIYEFECQCGNKFISDIYSVKSNSKKTCGRCNSIYNCRPDLIKYLKNKEDAHKYTCFGERYVDCVCPICNTERKILTSQLSISGFYCRNCTIKISYPEQLFRNVLNKLNIKYIYQYSTNWSNKIRYDFYLEDYNCIVELNGAQHYKHQKTSCFTTGEEQQNIDKYKKELALNNHILQYHEIDCSKSNLEFILNNIIQSRLNNILNIDSIYDFKDCEVIHKNDLTLKLIELYNKQYSQQKIADTLKISVATVGRYLERLNNSNLITYNKRKTPNRNPDFTKCVLDNMIFNSLAECSRYEGNTKLLYYLKGTTKMPQRYIDRGLRYYDKEKDFDCIWYKQ